VWAADANRNYVSVCHALVNASSCVLGQYAREMFLPDPADCLGGVVLVACKPELALHADDVEDLARDVDQVRDAAFASVVCDVEFEETGGKE
jgi:hypothetical protein